MLLQGLLYAVKSSSAELMENKILHMSIKKFYTHNLILQIQAVNTYIDITEGTNSVQALLSKMGVTNEMM